ncbi:MAG: hypothetical protein JF606_24165 [Burkholderiales bacterium]|nr:hypothetical protein [Burkholderiales bacterium]
MQHQAAAQVDPDLQLKTRNVIHSFELHGKMATMGRLLWKLLAVMFLLVGFVGV